MNKTPDIRTRAFLPKWCAQIDIAFVTPTLAPHTVVSLLANAGVIVGIGDYRQEKGRGSFGTWGVIDTKDQNDIWDDLQAEGRALQQHAFDHPEVMADDYDTADLMEMLGMERGRRRAA